MVAFNLSIWLTFEKECMQRPRLVFYSKILYFSVDGTWFTMTLYNKIVNAIIHIRTNLYIVSKAEENDGQDKSKLISTFHRRRGNNRSKHQRGSRPLCRHFLRAGPCYAPKRTRFHKGNVGEIGCKQESYDNCDNIVITLWWTTIAFVKLALVWTENIIYSGMHTKNIPWHLGDRWNCPPHRARGQTSSSQCATNSPNCHCRH